MKTCKLVLIAFGVQSYVHQMLYSIGKYENNSILFSFFIVFYSIWL